MAARYGSLTRSLLSTARWSGSTSRFGFGSTSSPVPPLLKIERCRLQSNRSLFTAPRTLTEQLLAASCRTSSQIPQVDHSMLGGLGIGSHLSSSLNAHEGLASGYFLSQLRTFVQMRTVLKVVDNSGAKKVMCIQALKGKKGARLGETVVVSVKEALPYGKAKKGNVYHAIVVHAAMQRGRCDGSEVKFDDNACVLVDKQGQPIGTRVFGPVPHELRKKNHVKILTLAQHIA